MTAPNTRPADVPVHDAQPFLEWARDQHGRRARGPFADRARRTFPAVAAPACARVRGPRG